MNLALTAKEWFMFGVMLLTWAFSSGVLWTKLNTKIDTNTKEIDKKVSREELNGMSARIDGIKNDCSEHTGAMTEFKRELTQYRQEAREATGTLNRIEQSNLEIASRLAELNKAIVAMDKTNSNRLTRIETVQQIEKKVGPLPTE